MTTKTYHAVEIAKLIRTELKAAFGKQKFSVTSNHHGVRVGWTDGVSHQAVAAITDKFGGMGFDGMQDLQTYKSTVYNGELVTFYIYKPDLKREFTPEFAQKVIAKATAINPQLKIEYHSYGDDLTGTIHSISNSDNYSYRMCHEVIGTISAANIDEPVAAPIEEVIVDTWEPTPYQVITPILIVAVDEETGSGTFPSSNKNCTIEEYRGQERENIEDVRITDRVELSPADYDVFTQTLMSGQTWLAGKGGSGSDTAPAGTWQTWNAADWDEYRKGVYTLVVEVFAANRPTLYINPEGSDYARYVGFPVIKEQPAPRPVLTIVSSESKYCPAPITSIQTQYKEWVQALIIADLTDEIVSYAQWRDNNIDGLYKL